MTRWEPSTSIACFRWASPRCSRRRIWSLLGSHANVPRTNARDVRRLVPGPGGADQLVRPSGRHLQSHPRLQSVARRVDDHRRMSCPPVRCSKTCRSPPRRRHRKDRRNLCRRRSEPADRRAGRTSGSVQGAGRWRRENDGGCICGGRRTEARIERKCRQRSVVLVIVASFR